LNQFAEVIKYEKTGDAAKDAEARKVAIGHAEDFLDHKKKQMKTAKKTADNQ
jgi:hypothetical protein